MKGADIGSKPQYDQTTSQLISLIKENNGKVAVITGAGISSHCLPTFRSSHGGLWDVMQQDTLSADHFYSNPLPAWKLSANVISLQLKGFLKPSISHKVIHKLQSEKVVISHITQNIDSLHNFNDGVETIELHGAISEFGFCHKCKINRIVNHIEILREGKSPVCGLCKSTLRPPVAFFQDKIPLDKRKKVNDVLLKCEVLLLVGTHCTVDPVNSIAHQARSQGIILVEINPEETAATSFVDISIHETADSVFKQISDVMFPDFDFNQ